MSKKGFSALKDYVVELKDLFENAVTRAEKAENRIAELTDALNRVCDENRDFVAESIKDEARIAELEANVKTLRKSGIGLIGILEEILYAVSIDKSCNARVRAIAATLEQQIKAVREGK